MYYITRQGSSGRLLLSSEEICVLCRCCLSLIYWELWRANLDKAGTFQHVIWRKHLSRWLILPWSLWKWYLLSLSSCRTKPGCFQTHKTRSHQLTYGWHHNLPVSWKIAPVSRNGAPTAADVPSLSPCFSICALTGGKTPDKALNAFTILLGSQTCLV